ncbi:hypothetical protein GCM10009560_11570 [Nonomuraea longicatena]|uniref:DUF6879 domain-containing protein n=1 Tax=Nonomuraea longicatena TaxID=83682 RepID=A0ABP3Z941_9ACTN
MYILDTSKTPIPTDQLVDHDWWLLDDSHVLRMHYDMEGRFLGAEPLDSSASAHVESREALMSVAVPFEPWWAAHPEYHRAANL